MRDRGKAGDQTFGERASGGASDVAPVPGRQSLVQLSMAPAEASPEPQPAPAGPPTPMAQLPSYASIRQLFGNRVQAKATAGPGPTEVHAAPPRAGERWGHAFWRAAEEEQGQRLALVE